MRLKLDITLEEVYRECARLRVAYYDGNENYAPFAEKVQQQYKDIVKQCYDLPELQPFVSAWMVDIQLYVAKSLHDQLDCARMNLTTLREHVVGEIADHVGLRVSDSGCDVYSGYVGYLCTDAERRALLDFVHTRFRTDIDAGLLCPTTAWFSPKFAHLWDREDCVKYLNETTESNKP